MNSRILQKMLPIAVVPVIGVIVTLMLQSNFYINLFTLTLLWAVFALSWNIISGYAGLISFGHAVFWGVGAYTIVLLQVSYNITPWIGLFVAVIMGVLAGAFIGLITLRLSGIYFGLAMLCYPTATVYLFEYLGLQELTIPMQRENALYFMQFEDQTGYSFVALILLTIGMMISFTIENSRMGLWLRLIRQNEPAAQALGVDCFRWKFLALLISGGLAAVAGALYAQVVLIITPHSVFGILVSAQAIILTLFGGIGTFWGPVLGAGILVPLGELLKYQLGAILPGISGVVFGAIVVATVLFAPSGLYWRIFRKHLSALKSDPYSVTVPDILGYRQAPPSPVSARSEKFETILQVRDLTCSFGGVTAVNNVSFDLQCGEILGVIGPNGAGKTTLLNLINGYIPSDGGSVRFCGAEILGEQTHKIARSGIGRTFQVARAFPQMTLFGNIAVGAVATFDQWKDRVQSIMVVTGIEHRANELAENATAFDLRLMELARAAVAEPVLLLVDECLAGLSETESEVVTDALKTLRNQGMTIIIIEHTMRAMVRLADRFLVLDNGVVIADGPPNTVTCDPHVLEAYLGRKWAKQNEHA